MKRKTNKAQSVVEYVILFALVLAGLIASAFFKDVQKPFQDHFDACVNEMVN